MFGFSMLIRENKVPNRYSTKLRPNFTVIIGAPNLQRIDSDGPIDFQNKRHFGWNLLLDESSRYFLTCDFGEIKKIEARDSYHYSTFPVPNGACYLFDFESKDLKRKYEPMENEKQFTSNGGYLHSYGMAGFSAQFVPGTNDNDRFGIIMAGSPGYDDWRGTIAVSNKLYRPIDHYYYHNPEFLLLSNEKIPKYSYLGYSLIKGKFFQNSNTIIAGAPRANLTGSILIWNSNNIGFEIFSTIQGLQPGEYFGHTLLGIDTNTDGYDDLLVGAPMFSSFQKDSNDEGRVFYYRSNGTNFFSPTILIGRSKPMARFGSSMISLGDINNDLFNDVAIGAPFEDGFKGSVYIYLGNSLGLSDRFTQIISASDHFTTIDLNSFGYSFAIASDHFLIGAFMSEKVILLRTRRVLKIKAEIETEIDEIDLKQKCHLSPSTSIDDSSSCFDLNVCFESIDKINTDIDLKVAIEFKPKFHRNFIQIQLVVEK
ncbi:oxidation resistance protein 1 [Sarcoptes scabiei]|nr:oxidation resistance protein 1 [Sarcoptes scabiei]